MLVDLVIVTVGLPQFEDLNFFEKKREATRCLAKESVLMERLYRVTGTLENHRQVHFLVRRTRQKCAW